MWSVPPPTIPEARETHDVSNVLHTESFSSSFVSALNAAPNALVHTLPRTSQFPTLPPTLLANASHSLSSSDAYLLPALHRARLTKSDAEVQRVRRANEISSRAHEVVMRVLGAGVRTVSLSVAAGRDSDSSPRHHSLLPGEWLIEREAEAEAIFVASCRREGYAGVSTSSCHKNSVVDDLRVQCCSPGIFAHRSGVDACSNVALLL